MSIKYKIGDKVKTNISDEEGIVIATDDVQDKYAKVKVKFNNFFRTTSWEFECCLNRILEDKQK